MRVVCELRHTYLRLTEALQKPSAIDRAARMRDGWIASPTLIREGTAPRVISIVSAAEIMVGSQTLSSCGADLRPRLLVRGTSCAGACAEPRLSWHSGRSPDHGIGRRSRKIRRGMIRLIEPHPWPERRSPPGESLATCGWWRVRTVLLPPVA